MLAINQYLNIGAQNKANLEKIRKMLPRCDSSSPINSPFEQVYWSLVTRYQI